MPPNDSALPGALGLCYPFELEPSFRERVWGQQNLSFLYASRPAEPLRVGEVWLTADDNRIANGAWAGRTLGEVSRAFPALLGRGARRDQAGTLGAVFPLLVKFIFTADKLSVQVHPSDQYARPREGCDGKTEMWHVLKAEPGARLAIGFREDLARGRGPDRSELKQAIQTGAIEGKLNWITARRGDTFFVPAGTVHAIGAGLVLCEIQQNSDLTYRLYDYNRHGTDGRPRELHIEKALDVIEWQASSGRTEPLPFGPDKARTCLAACRYFATEKITMNNSARFAAGGRFEVWIGVEGEAEFEIAGAMASCRAGEALIIPATAETFSIRPVARSVFLRSYQPLLEADVLGPLRARGFSEQQLNQVCFLG